MIDSGVEWIGEIPQDWLVQKIYWTTSKMGSGTTPDSDSPEYYSPEEMPWVNTGDLNDSILSHTKKFVTTKAVKKFSALKVYPKGSLVLAMYGATIGKLSVVNFDTTVNQACAVMNFKSHISPKFIFYWFLANRSALIDLSYGSGQPNISQKVVKDFEVLVPDIKEQECVSDFLDEKTAVIDQVVKKKKKQIELLKEKRAALITQAVTKGLDPDVKMKDSGVEWIGEIPEGWSVKKLKYLAPSKDAKREYNKNTDQYVGLENIVSKLGKLVIPEDPHHPESVVNVYNSGDVLFAKLRPYLAKAFVAESAGVCTSELLVMSPKSRMVLPDFLLDRVLADDFIEAVNTSTYGSKMPRASWNFIGNLAIAWPSISEQKQIADYLDMKTVSIDNTIEKIQKSIRLIQEYRSSLISHAVTGKIVIN